jgi:16S rRNA (guanine966-N2)-methyltransferase
MRVIAGSLKGRRLKAPTWEGLRPTSDTLRETLFNVLAPRVGAVRVLDGFAGTGGLGIEALSRGAAHVTFLERDARAQALIAENLALCGIAEGYAIIRASFDRGLETLRSGAGFAPFDIVLLDPPYDQADDTMLETLTSADSVLAPDGLVVLEHARRQMAPGRAGRLVLTRRLVSGDSALAFYQKQVVVRKSEV